MAAWRVEAFTEKWADFRIGSLQRQVNLGKLPRVFAESDDPNRMVPIVLDPEDFIVLVSGDPLRTNAYTFTHNGYLGFPVGKKKIGSASCRERACQYVEISVVAVPLKKKKTTQKQK